MSEGKDRSANHTNQDLTTASADNAQGRDQSDRNRQQGGPAGQGQHGEEYGVYGRGATEGGRYADHGDSPGEVNPPQRNIAQQDIARKDGQPAANRHADPEQIPPRGDTGRGDEAAATGLYEVGRGEGAERYREAQSAIDFVQESHEPWTAPRQTTWKQNSGAETDFGGKRPGREASGKFEAE